MSISDGRCGPCTSRRLHRVDRVRDGPSGGPCRYGSDPGSSSGAPGEPSQLNREHPAPWRPGRKVSDAVPQRRGARHSRRRRKWATAPGGSSSGNSVVRPRPGAGPGRWVDRPNPYNFPRVKPLPPAAVCAAGPGSLLNVSRSVPRIQPVQLERCTPQAAPRDRRTSPPVRPYAMTGGRTRPRYQLAIEALVHTTAQPHQMQSESPEHQRICNLCLEIKSVAEISALLTIPLGVARILVADLACRRAWSPSISPAATRTPAASQT